MKKGVLILVLFLFSFSYVFGADDCTIESTSCPAGKYVASGLGFYSDSNTHAGFTVSDYFFCCDYPGMGFVNSVSGADFLLFNTLNSHVAIDTSISAGWLISGYQVGVDLRDASCSAISSGSCSKSIDDFCLFSASAGGNAHVSSCSDPNYSWKLCCEYTGGPLGCSADSDCGDSNICTDDLCNAGSCENNPNTASCNDGDSCTVSDVCSLVGCLGIAVGCVNNDGCCPSGCTALNDNDCSAPSSPPPAGPNEYLVYDGECVDDGSGDQYGVTTWTLYAGNGSVLDDDSSLCVLYSSNAPFLGLYSILLFFIFIFGFYFRESYLNNSLLNNKRGESIANNN